MNTVVRYSHEALVAAITVTLERAGLSREVASVEADLAVEADFQGVPSHGIIRIPELLKGLADGRITASGTGRLVKDKAAICVLDGDRGPGRFLSAKAMDEAVLRAKSFGIGACLASRTSHWGRAHAYAAQAARQGLIGLCMTNATTSMAAWGKTGRVVGNNPLAIGVPGLDRDEPIVLDMAMSQAAVGKVATWLREGRSVPPQWGVDAEGRQTEDPSAILKGAVLPTGGHKGAGLALMIQLMTAALAGGLLDHELREHDAAGLDAESSKLFLAIDIEAFIDPAVFRAKVATLLKWLNAQPGSESEPFLFPGQRGWTEKRANRDLGVPVHADIVAKLEAAGIVLPRRL
jgi:LDH2 family malate/lactate/ureidoglycolate dehydrogenase